MKSKFKVLFMTGTHAATCDRVVIFCTKVVPQILREIFVKTLLQIAQIVFISFCYPKQWIC